MNQNQTPSAPAQPGPAPERWDVIVRNDIEQRSMRLYVTRRPGNIFVADFQGEKYVVQYFNGEPYIDIGHPMREGA